MGNSIRLSLKIIWPVLAAIAAQSFWAGEKLGSLRKDIDHLKEVSVAQYHQADKRILRLENAFFPGSRKLDP